MGKTSCYQEKKKKTKVRKFINRAKNGLQRVRKFCRQHVMPVMLSTAIIGGVIFGTYLRATATGVEELFYTYWDLVSSIFAAEGYDMSIKNGNDKISTPDRVTGRQLWNNIKQWVKIKCADAKDLYDELTLLPKAVTAEGIKMSKDLYDLLGDYCAELIASNSNPNQFDTSSANSVVKMLTAMCGIKSGLYAQSDVVQDVCDGYALNVVKQSDGNYNIFTNNSGYMVKDYVYGNSQKVWVSLVYLHNGNEVDTGAKHAGYVSSGKFITEGAYPYSARAPVTWVIKNGAYAGDIFNKVKDAVDLKNAPDQKVDDNVWNKEGNEKGVLPWWYYPDLLDRSMRNQSVDNERFPEGDPDDGDDNKDKNGKSWKDILPALIPWVPTVVNPTETEKDSEKDSEKDTESDSKKNPMINPDTGRYIDPDTGYDIDPDTGKLIDPDTGELIEPDIPSTAGKAGNWKRLFPFCIPWDMMELIKSMQADKKAPVFEFKYTFKAVNYTWVVKVDMSDYWKYIKIFRWGMTIFFIIGLFFLTVKFTTFVQRMGG